jgi:hypothetical protein
MPCKIASVSNVGVQITVLLPRNLESTEPLRSLPSPPLPITCSEADERRGAVQVIVCEIDVHLRQPPEAGQNRAGQVKSGSRSPPEPRR